MNRKLESLRRSAAGFLGWWLAELLELLPERLRRRVHLVRERLIIVPEGDGYALAREEGEAREALGRFAASEEDTLRSMLARHGGQRELVLEVPAADVLITDVSLPSAAEENLHQVLYYEMDRHTPFTGAQVQFGYRWLGGRTAAGLLPLRLAVIPHRVLAGYLEALQALGVRPQRVQPAREPAIDLTPAAAKPPRRLRPSMRATMAAGVVVIVLLLIAFPIWALNQTLGTLNEEVTDIAATANEAQTLSERRDRLEQQARFIAERRGERPPVVAAMEEMATILPDNTWIWNFRVDGSDVVIRGATPSASGLIERIERSPMFRGAGFSAPITRENGSERFQITTQLAEASG